MSQDQLNIASVTGVDVEFQIAGPGSRSYAFIIDWHMRVLLAFAWFVMALLIISGGLSFAGISGLSSGMSAMIWAPAVVFYMFYHPLLEILMHGRTPGKRIAGVRILTCEGDVPGVGALLIRNLFRLIDSLPGLYIVGLITTFVTRQHVRFGDMAAGTILVIDHDRDGKSLRQLDRFAGNANLDPKTADLIDELVERWQQLGSKQRRGLAVALLKRIDRRHTRAEIEALKDRELLVSLKDAIDVPTAASKQP
jgi:uncharacterized RDD family membrane protein YckC